MENLPESIDLNEKFIEVALHYQTFGFRPIPLPHLSKGKGMRFKWKPYQSRAPTEDEVREWFSAGESNIALVTGSGLVVVDVDSANQQYLEGIIEQIGDTPMRSRTPSGGTHLFFKMRKGVHYGNAVKANGRPIDLRCEGAYVCVAWSRTVDGSYRWEGPVLPVEELPLMKVTWLRERKPKRVLQPIEVSANLDLMVRRARSYLAHVEGSVSGNHGHDRAMRAAGILCQKFSLSFEQAFPIFKEWSEASCSPPWSDSEITHKLQEAIRLRAQKGLKPIE